MSIALTAAISTTRPGPGEHGLLPVSDFYTAVGQGGALAHGLAELLDDRAGNLLGEVLLVVFGRRSFLGQFLAVDQQTGVPMRAVAASRGVVYEPWGRSSRPGDPSTPTGPFPGGLKWPPRRSLWCWVTRTKT
jgi:hypothetical protein